MAFTRLRVGKVPLDLVSFNGALEAISELVESKRGGFVVTPNVDHVVLAEDDPRFRDAYADASLSLIDGTPLFWSTRLLGEQAPAKVSGSDLVEPLMARAGERGWKVYLLGAMPGVAARAGEIFTQRYRTQIVGAEGPMLSLNEGDAATAAAFEKVEAAKPDLLLLALGAPKQEILMHRWRKTYAPAVALGIGASLDFVAGTVKRAPVWMQKSGLEWAYRLGQEPRRLWRRYLVNDPRFLKVLAETLARPRSERVFQKSAV
jgi:N-acetylglucosaminyldiphosphoundecaprenol N-acetyl-beta-D-mannosaminyltransferase